MSVPEPVIDSRSALASGIGRPRAEPGVLRAVSGPGHKTLPGATLAAALELLSRMIPGVRGAFVGLDPHGAGEFVVSEFRPAGQGADPALVAVAFEAASGHVSVARTAMHAGAVESLLLACPMRTEGHRCGALAIRLDGIDEHQRDTVSRLLEWGAAWLALVAPFRLTEQVNTHAQRLEVLHAGLGQASLTSSATAIAAEVARVFGCERASIGLLERDRMNLVSLSHGARFDPRTQLSRDIVAAMDEAVDEAGTVVLPELSTVAAESVRAHDRLQRGRSHAGICTVLLRDGEQPVGALTLERAHGAAFDEATVDQLEALGESLGALLALKRAAHRPALARAGDSLRGVLVRGFGRGRILPRLVLAALLAAVVALSFLDGDYRVAAPATLEGAVHRSVVAPVDGYVEKAPVRSGDAVRAGDLLASIDTRELEHERRSVLNERTEIEKSYRQAVASLDRAKVRILKARLGKVDSELALVDDQIDRARVLAPFDGMVVSGDLSHALGAPVTRGDVLFEVAPLDDYRIELEVSERDVAEVEPGLRGELALAALPGESLRFVVDKVVGVASTTSDARNAFRVEARLESDGKLLRPGMRGVGKIVVDRRRLVWVWTHDLVDRLRLWLWSHTP